MGLLKPRLPHDVAERMLDFYTDVSLLEAEAVQDKAFSSSSSNRPSWVSGKACRFPGCIATRKPMALHFIPRRFSIPW
jgi:hypothetical protein